MSLYENHRRCPSCDYWADKKEWSNLRFSSTSGYGALILTKYDPVGKTKQHAGARDLLVCPMCKTVILET